jgi:hypothetical protein
MTKQKNILLASIISLFLIVLLGVLIGIPIRTSKEVTPKKEFKIQKNIAEPTEFDSLVVEEIQGNPWPIRVQSVEKSDEKNTPKWQVVAENGVMYYTNKKPKIGDIAFYLNDNDEITDKYGNGVERTR